MSLKEAACYRDASKRTPQTFFLPPMPPLYEFQRPSMSRRVFCAKFYDVVVLRGRDVSSSRDHARQRSSHGLCTYTQTYVSTHRNSLPSYSIADSSLERNIENQLSCRPFPNLPTYILIEQHKTQKHPRIFSSKQRRAHYVSPGKNTYSSGDRHWST